MEFAADGWFTVSTPPHVATKKPAGFNVSSAEILSDNFKHEASQPTQWRSKGILDISRITRDGSGLHFRGVSTSIGESNPLTIITGDSSFEIETEISLEGICSAGLIYMYDTNIYNSLSFTGSELIIHRIGKVLARVPHKADRCSMKMLVDRGYLSFWYKDGTNQYRKLNYVIDTNAQNTLAYGGFLSMRPGIFSTGHGTAFFASFNYVGLK